MTGKPHVTIGARLHSGSANRTQVVMSREKRAQGMAGDQARPLMSRF
jgi:hypothetical protein